MKQVTIVSDGTANNTKIYDIDGKQIKGATKIELKVSAYDESGVTTAIVTFENVRTDVEDGK